MAGTSKGARKSAADKREKYGVDENGKSLYHAAIGALGGAAPGSGFFGYLKMYEPDKLSEISKKGGKKKRGNDTDKRVPSTEAQDDAERPLA